MATLEEIHHFNSALSPADLVAALSEKTEPTSWPPPLILKLSGGGIVSRVMQSPDTQQPFFGVVSPDRIRVAVSTWNQQVTSFQPILLLTVTDSGAGGSAVEVKLRPHREASSFAGLFAGVGALVIVAAIPAALGGEPAALAGMVVGALGLVFPTFRAKACFESDRDQALAALRAALPLEG